MEKKPRVKKPIEAVKVPVEGIQSLTNNPELQIHLTDYIVGSKKNKGVSFTLNSLHDLPGLIKAAPITWEQAKKLADSGKCIRCSDWEQDMFIFIRKAVEKYVTKDSTAKTFYHPLTLEWLKEQGVKSFTIGTHWNKWWPGSKSLQVGYIVSRTDKESNDWEEYKTS